MNIESLIAAFGAGILGAAIGALPSFILTGIVVLVGVSGGLLANSSGWSIIDTIGFGIFLGPHITFASGVAASNYAMKKGYLKTGDTKIPLIKFYDANILIVGGLFGLFGYVINNIMINVGVPTDTIALTVVISAVIGRILFSKKGLIPSVKNKSIKFFKLRGSFKISLIMGFSIGILSSYYAFYTGDTLLAWSIGAIGLIFVQMGYGGYAYHHIAIVSAIATISTNNIYIGVLFGVITSILADIFNSIFNDEADTLICPAAMSIVVLTTLLLFL